MKRIPENGRNVVRVAAVGDLHATEASAEALRPLFEQVAQAADVLALCGDLTDFGLPGEAHALAKAWTGAAGGIPTVAVLGNHDYESGQAEQVRKILCDAGIHLLDGEACELKGVGFAGVKGFGGGFGRATLSAFGEPATKAFVQEAVDEALKLERALQRLRTPHRIAVLHYAPVRDTVEGEPAEIFTFLGCSRLEEPLNRYQVTAALHGHAHRGAAEGKTAAGVPVYNVGLPVMRANYPKSPPFRVLTLPVGDAKPATAAEAEEAPVETRMA